MIVSIEIPDAMASQMHLDGAEGSHRALEACAIEGYRSGQLSRGQVSELLGLSLWETEALLKERDCGLGITFAEYERDVEGARAFLAR
jgi:predicted HTH domain antitoxin